MKSTKKFLAAALAALTLAGCAQGTTSEENKPENVESVVDSAAASLDEDTVKELDAFNEKAQDIFAQLHDLSDKDLSQDEVKDLKDKIAKEIKDLYEDTESAYNTVRERVAQDPALQKSLDDLKDASKDLMDKISSESEDDKTDITKITDAMKNFSQEYLKSAKGSVSSLDEETAKELDSFREKAQDIFNQIRDLKDETLSDADAQELKDKIKQEITSLYQEGESAYDQVRERVAQDPELQKSLDELKDATSELMDKISGDVQENEMDITKMTDAMKNFDQEYFRANNLR